jgi:hypothetical protein
MCGEMRINWIYNSILIPTENKKEFGDTSVLEKHHPKILKYEKMKRKEVMHMDKTEIIGKQRISTD